MRTPAGQECRFYYEDYHRGRTVQECRLLDRQGWRPRVCTRCPVPGILRANRCPHMVLRGEVTRRWLRLRVQVAAYCERHGVAVENPYVGCGRCHDRAALVLAAGEGDQDDQSPSARSR